MGRNTPLGWRQLKLGVIVTFCAALAIILIMSALLTKSEVLFSVDVQTDIVTLEPIGTEQTPVVLRLPHASFLFEDEMDNFINKEKPLAGTASIALVGRINLQLQSNEAGHLNLRAWPLESPMEGPTEDTDDAAFRIYDETGLIHDGKSGIELISKCTAQTCDATQEIQFFTEVTRVQAGGSYRRWEELTGAGLRSYSQPILQSGQVSAFAEDKYYGDSFLLETVSLDVGDVVHVEAPAKVQVSFDMSQTPAGRLAVRVYANGKALRLDRLNGQTDFSVDRYAVISKQPFLQVFWLTLVSVIIVFSFILSIADVASRVETPGSEQGSEDAPTEADEAPSENAQSLSAKPSDASDTDETQPSPQESQNGEIKNV